MLLCTNVLSFFLSEGLSYSQENVQDIQNGMALTRTPNNPRPQMIFKAMLVNSYNSILSYVKIATKNLSCTVHHCNPPSSRIWRNYFLGISNPSPAGWQPSLGQFLLVATRWTLLIALLQVKGTNALRPRRDGPSRDGRFCWEECWYVAAQGNTWGKHSHYYLHNLTRHFINAWNNKYIQMYVYIYPSYQNVFRRKTSNLSVLQPEESIFFGISRISKNRIIPGCYRIGTLQQSTKVALSHHQLEGWSLGEIPKASEQLNQKVPSDFLLENDFDSFWNICFFHLLPQLALESKEFKRKKPKKISKKKTRDVDPQRHHGKSQLNLIPV